MIRLEHVQKTFSDGSQVLTDVNATINKGDVVAVIGASGTGKSTLLRCINMLDGPTAGRIILDGEEITEKDYPVEKIHKKVCMVFQSFNLFEHLSIIENIMLPQVVVLKKGRQEAYDEGMSLLSSVGMANKRDFYPDALSGGQKQRVAIARTLAMAPKLILFDEPTSALDPSSVGEVKNVITSVSKSGVTCIIVTHDMEFARQISNRVFYMDQGVVYEEGTPDEIFDHPKLERTKEFIRKYKSIEEDITDKKFDYPAFMARIWEYGLSNRLSESEILDIQLFSEELIFYILFSKLREPFRIRLIYEFKHDEHKMHILVDYSGEKQNIFDLFDYKGFDELEGEQFKASVHILRSKIDGFEYHFREDKTCANRIIMRLK